MEPMTLRDIKPIVEVPDSSLWIFTALVLAMLALLGMLIFWLIRRKRQNSDRYRAAALRRLDALDFEDTKKAAYDFTLLAHYAAAPQQRTALQKLLEALEPYKFKKVVPKLDKALIHEMKAFIKEARRG